MMLQCSFTQGGLVRSLSVISNQLLVPDMTSESASRKEINLFFVDIALTGSSTRSYKEAHVPFKFFRLMICPAPTSAVLLVAGCAAPSQPSSSGGPETQNQGLSGTLEMAIANDIASGDFHLAGC